MKLAPKQNNKKAFTLVELLAVIVIIAVVLIITVPSVTNIISSNYRNAYNLNLEAIEKAAKDYVTKNSIRIEETGQKIITIQKMIEENLINEVRDPQTKELCDGYVVVSKSGKKNIYEPFLKCGNTYLSDNYDSTNLVPPTITLLGSNPAYLYINEEYMDAGVRAVDYQGFDLTDDVKLTSNLNPSVPGEYFITYTVFDEIGNKGTLTRTIMVVDNLSPNITFSPNKSDIYTKKVDVTIKVDDKGGVDNSSLKYIWTNSLTQPSSAEFTLKYRTNELISSPEGITGTYYLWAMAKDTSGNLAVKRSEGFKLDNTAPIITINGGDVVNVAKGSSYSDEGATAIDAHSGLKGNVTSSGTVNPKIVGTYTITYKAIDEIGNLAIAIRTVNVVDVDAPVITIIGSNPVNIEIGTTYSDAGATAVDDEDGDVTSKISMTTNVNPNSLGTYTVTYTVTDNAGNKSTTTRTVNVVDITKPTIVFGTNGNTTYAKNRSTTVTVNDNVGVNASSLKYLWNTSTSTPSETSITTSFTNGGTINTPAGVTGDYYLWILAKDTSGNTTIIRSNVFRLDNTKPVITLTGDSTVTVNAGTTYSDAGATATDAHSGINGSVSVTGNINTSVVGTYTVTYSASDKVGNTANTVTRSVIVVDATAPTVTFNPNENNVYSQRWGSTVSVSDTYGTVNTSSLKYLWNTSTSTPSEASITTPFTNGQSISSPDGVTGIYYLWVIAKDNSGNTAIVRTNGFKLDNIKPVITRNGNATVNVNRGSSYSDAGATATDNIDTSVIVTSSGTVNVNVVGTYTITYTAYDSSGNAATPVIRTVNVIDATAPVIAIKGSNPVTSEIKASYSDAGATALDDVDGDVTSRITTSSTVNPNVVGNYTVTYTVTDNAGNKAVATRTVYIRDRVAPVITVVHAGAPKYGDPTFASGLNSTQVYNNSANGNVTRTRVAISGAPLGSGYGLEIKTVGAASPGWGGFYFGTPTSANKVFITRIVAKIPVGYTINWASNATGDGRTASWLTTTNGTGTWKEYLLQLNTGSTGTFSSTNFFYLTGGSTPTTSSPLIWHVAYANVIDTTAWGKTNSVMMRATDSGTGIVGYGVNQSSTTAPTFTSTATAEIFGSGVDDLTANGTYYAWVKDQSGNVSNKSFTLSYVDRAGPTISETYAGTALQTDPTFASGTNSMSVYNNSGGGTVVHSRLAMTTPTGSGYAMKIVTSGTASPGLGGFVQYVTSKANGVYIHRMIAKIPVGYTIQRASNAVGTGGTHTWITDQVGTGDWKEYIYITRAGSTGTFSSFGHVYISGTAGTASNPITWYVAYSAIYDTTQWGTNNNVVIKGSDSASGIVGYGINQSSTTAPAFTTIPKANNLGIEVGKVTANGTYYVWTKDEAGNTSNKAISVTYVDPASPTVSAKGSSYTITEGDSNVISSAYFNISANGSAPLSSTTCIDTSKGNAVVTNTSTLAVGSHLIRCTATKANGLSTYAQTTIVVNSKIVEYAFNYTGGRQTFTVPKTGTYKLEVWGAQGGGTQGGKGGYSVGTRTLTAGEKLYVEVGGKGNYTTSQSITIAGGFGGGGDALTGDYGYGMGAASGGGASTIYSQADAITILQRDQQYPNSYYFPIEKKKYSFLIYGYYGLQNVTKVIIGSYPYGEVTSFTTRWDGLLEFQYTSTFSLASAYLGLSGSGSYLGYNIVMWSGDTEPRLIVAGGGGGQGVEYIGEGYSRTLKKVIGGGAGGGTSGGGIGGGSQGKSSSTYVGGRSSSYPENGGRGFGGRGDIYNCGGGGGGFVGGAGGPNIGYASDFTAYYGSGGSGYIGGVTDGSMQSGVRTGNGYAKITYLGS